MDNQHRQIEGYRELDATEIALMNDVKQLAIDVGILVIRLREYDGRPKSDGSEVGPTLDQRWIQLGQDQLQQGFMALVRGIARPSTF